MVVVYSLVFSETRCLEDEINAAERGDFVCF